MFRKITNLAVALVFACLCWQAKAQSPDKVLVVANANNPQSVALAQYYMAARSVPSSNLVLLNWSPIDTADWCNLSTYTTLIAQPVYDKIGTLPEIDYIVLCRNLPTRIVDKSFAFGSSSVDSCLAIHSTTVQTNPYLNAPGRFSAARYGMRLVTRLDGWSWADAQALVDRSIRAIPGNRFDMFPYNGIAASYRWWNDSMRNADALLKARGMNSTVDQKLDSTPLMGFATWGSNGWPFFSQTNYGQVASFQQLTFLPGGIAETAVSTSGLYLRTPPTNKKAQSQIAQLIQRGVTGVKGYVAEPYLAAMARPDMLFDRYTRGYNLAESFYGASLFVGWKDIVIGDPLCSPFQR
jgi:uncharacterized protein (TIGR03790 family)